MVKSLCRKREERGAADGSNAMGFFVVRAMAAGRTSDKTVAAAVILCITPARLVTSGVKTATTLRP